MVVQMGEYTFRMDEDGKRLWAGERTYPARLYRHSFADDIPPDDPVWRSLPDYRMETRRALVCFENQWELSTIWGDATYSSNRMTLDRPLLPFIEEPTAVEVGLLAPAPFVIEAVEFEIPNGGKIEMPARETHLWGDPIGWVTVPEYHRLADVVMNLPTEMELPEMDYWDSVEAFCDFIVTLALDQTL